MKVWFTWRTMIGSIVLGLAFTGTFILLTGQTVSLSGLDLFFTITTIISLGFNVWQFLRDQYKYAPLRDSLIGLFNDLKGRSLRAYMRQQLIVSHAGMTQTLESVRLQFYDFVQETTQDFEQLREHVVALINTLDPNLSSQEVFRAADFGLTEQERQFKKSFMERSKFLAPPVSSQAETTSVETSNTSKPPSGTT